MSHGILVLPPSLLSTDFRKCTSYNIYSPMEFLGINLQECGIMSHGFLVLPPYTSFLGFQEMQTASLSHGMLLFRECYGREQTPGPVDLWCLSRDIWLVCTSQLVPIGCIMAQGQMYPSFVDPPGSSWCTRKSRL